MLRALVGLGLVVTAAVGCGPPNPVATRDELLAALSAAEAGAVIELKAGEYAGPFVVPVGLTLKGAGEGRPVIVADANIALRFSLDGGGDVTVQGIDVRASGLGIVGSKAHAVTLADVAVASGTGVGVILEDIGAVTLRDVDVGGPVTADNINDLSGSFDGTQTAIAGLVLSRVPAAGLDDVSVHGFAGFGAIVTGSTGRWTGGAVVGNAGTSVLIEASTFELVGVVGSPGTELEFAL